MNKTPEYVPPAVREYYAELLRSAYADHSPSERKCWDNLIFRRRMQYIYGEFRDKLSTEGWRIFFDGVAQCAAGIDFKGLLDQRKKAYKLLGEILDKANSLADTLDDFEKTAADFSGVHEREIDLLPFTDTLSLLELTAKKTWCDGSAILKKLHPFHDVNKGGDLNSPAGQLRTLSELAKVIIDLAADPSCSLTPSESVLAAGLPKGREYSPAGVFVRAFCAKLEDEPELAPARSMGDKLLAILAEAALYTAPAPQADVWTVVTQELVRLTSGSSKTVPSITVTPAAVQKIKKDQRKSAKVKVVKKARAKKATRA